MADEQKTPDELEALLAYWKAGEATGRMESAMVGKTMIAILTELTGSKKDG